MKPYIYQIVGRLANFVVSAGRWPLADGAGRWPVAGARVAGGGSVGAGLYSPLHMKICEH